MFLKNEIVKINHSFISPRKNMVFLGCIPFGNIDYSAEYYTVLLEENIIVKNSIINRVSPVFLGCPEIWSDKEIYARNYIEQHNKNKTHIKKDRTKKLIEEKEKLFQCELILKDRENKPFVLFFVGGDDQSLFLRFTNEYEAKEYLEMADCFEDLFCSSEIQYY